MAARIAAVLLAVLAVVFFFWWQPEDASPEPVAVAPEMSAPRVPIEPPVIDERSFVVEGIDPIVGRVGAGLNAAEGTARGDLLILQEVLATWRTNASGLGNPVGDNQEITAALSGQNQWKFSIIPADHPAINERGELCDRWGTRLFFHQQSGDRMEIQSAGPDRERFTDDDVIVIP